MMKRVTLLASLLLGLAGTALADPVIDRVDFTLKRGRRLTVTVEATFAGPGEIRIDGDVNGVPVKLKKRVKKARVKRARFKVDARRLKLRRLSEPLVFDFTVVAAEAGRLGVTRDVRVSVPVPLVLLPGFGNEDAPGSLSAFALALDVAAGGVYERNGKRPDLVVHEYASRSESLASLGRGLGRTVKKLLRGTPFTQVDMVGYSMGGLVARSFMADGGGAGKVRRCVFMATPNEGTPLAYLAVQATEFGFLDNVLPAGTDQFMDLFFDSTSREALRTFFPTYPWAFATLPFLGQVEVPLGLIPDSTSPLTALNAKGPDPAARYDAVAYSKIGAVGLGLPVGTVDTVDFSGLIAGEGIALEDVASGEGDGLVPIRSVFMTDEPGWRDRVATHDMGTGTHVTMLLDPAVILKVAEILRD